VNSSFSNGEVSTKPGQLHLDTPRRVTQSWDGGVRWVWHSDPFGSIPPDDNPQGLGTFVYDARFPGQVYESAMGLHYNYFRDYDPQVGRYVESDPIGLDGGVILPKIS
jgi:RHS repeat-associated protein